MFRDVWGARIMEMGVAGWVSPPLAQIWPTGTPFPFPLPPEVDHEVYQCTACLYQKSYAFLIAKLMMSNVMIFNYSFIYVCMYVCHIYISYYC